MEKKLTPASPLYNLTSEEIEKKETKIDLTREDIIADAKDGSEEVLSYKRGWHKFNDLQVALMEKVLAGYGVNPKSIRILKQDDLFKGKNRRTSQSIKNKLLVMQRQKNALNKIIPDSTVRPTPASIPSAENRSVTAVIEGDDIVVTYQFRIKTPKF